MYPICVCLCMKEEKNDQYERYSNTILQIEDLRKTKKPSSSGSSTKIF